MDTNCEVSDKNVLWLTPWSIVTNVIEIPP